MQLPQDDRQRLQSCQITGYGKGQNRAVESHHNLTIGAGCCSEISED